MADLNTHQVILGQLQKISKYWHKRSLANWGVTQDQRTQFHIQIQYWGTHDAYFIFKENVSKPEAEIVINPIIQKITHANVNHQSANLNIDIDQALRVLDFKRTQQANV